MIKVVCWNVGYRKKPLEELAEMADNGEADVALLQEVGRGMARELRPGLETGSRKHWDSKTWYEETQYNRWPMVVKMSDKVDVEWFDQVGQDGEPSANEIALSGVGLLAVARVIPKDTKDGEPFIVASMYARPFFGNYLAAQIMASDLSSLIKRDVPDSSRILAAGDFNLNYVDYGKLVEDYQSKKPAKTLKDEFCYVYRIYEEDGERYTVIVSLPNGEGYDIRRGSGKHGLGLGWKTLEDARKWCQKNMEGYAELRQQVASRDAELPVSTWDSMKAIGLELMGPQSPNGRQPAFFPFWVPTNSENVVTYYDPGGSPKTGFRQLDYVFASCGFHERVKTRAMNSVEEWGTSDHCRIMIEVGPE